MKKKISFLFIVILFFILSLEGSLNIKLYQVNKSKEALQYEVTVTLKLVQVYVTDKKGNPVTDLEKSDFLVWDNGKPVKITDFERHILSLSSKKKPEKIKPPPVAQIRPPMNRKFFLFFDFAFNDAAGILKARKAALHFIDTELNPSDEVGVVSYSALKGLTLHEYLSADHQQIRKVIEGIGIKEALGRAADIEFDSWEDRGELIKKIKTTDKATYKGQVMNFSKQLKSFGKAIRYIPGSKHIILFSGGVSNSILYGDILRISGWPFNLGDVTLRTMYEKMAKELAASNSSVFPVNTQGLGTAHFKDRSDLGDYSLHQLAEISGGKYFDNVTSYEQIMAQIQNITSAYYVLGYYVNEKWDGKYHKLKVKVKRKGCKVFGQGGYFNPKPFTKYTETEKMLQLIDLALSDKPHFQEPLHFPLIALPFAPEKKSNLVLLAKIPEDKVREIVGRKMEVVSLIFDEKNNMVDFKRKELNSSGVFYKNLYYYTISSLSPGSYDCRLVVRNMETGKGAVGSSSVIIPEVSASGLKLYPPLLLVASKNAYYLEASPTAKKGEKKRGISAIYPFPEDEYSPLVEGLKQGTEKILAVVRCGVAGLSQPEIHLSGYLLSLSSGKKIPLSLS
ncbi:MAG: VWA domain-containing protein, partial [Candidatus Aminicenantales bacterium]